MAFRKNPPSRYGTLSLQLAPTSKRFLFRAGLCLSLHLLQQLLPTLPLMAQTKSLMVGRKPWLAAGLGVWDVQTDGNSANCWDPGCTASQTASQTVGQLAG